jgi:hypothetical protein
MAVGYRSRIAAAVTLLLVLSMGFRNPLVLNSGHSLLRQLLVWSVLLPIGARWSVDARRRPTDGSPADTVDERPLVASVATVGLFVQVLVVYGMNAVLKARGRAWTSGDAVERVFGMDAITVWLGDVLAGQSLLLAAGTHAWVLLLYATPLLVLATGRLRALVVGAFASAHLGMALTLSLGVFPLVSIAGLLVFVPPFVWLRVERMVDAHLEPRAERAVEAIPSPGGLVAGGSPDLPRSVGTTRSSLRTVGRVAYRVAPVVLLAGVLVWNAAGFGLLALPGPVTDTVDPTEHRWDMFAPNPLSTDAWYETVGTTTSGERVDAYAGTAGLGPPEDVDATYPSQKWYLYLRNLRGGDADARRDRFGTYLCERWDRRHETTLASVNVTLVLENVKLDAPNERRVEDVASTTCGG